MPQDMRKHFVVNTSVQTLGGAFLFSSHFQVTEPDPKRVTVTNDNLAYVVHSTNDRPENLGLRCTFGLRDNGVT